jgi:hypothetical protein
MAEVINKTRLSSAWPDTGRTVAVYVAAALISILAGVISTSGRPGIIAIFIGLMAGIAVISSRKALLWFVIIGGLVVVGTTQLYLPGSKYIRYIVPLATYVLIFHWAMDYMGKRTELNSPSFPAPVKWAISFIVLALISTIINRSDAGVAFMGLKGYFQMWALFFGLVFVRWRPEIIDSIPKGILLIAFLQLPFVLHQYFVLVPKRIGIGSGVVAVDVVAGTFGATVYGGGANAVLAAFMMIVVACLVALWKNGVLSTVKTAGMSLLFLAPVFVNEAKISIFYLPLIFVVIFYQEILKKPLKFLISGIAMMGILAALMTALTLAQPSGKLRTWTDLVNFTIERQTASTSERRGQFSELSRITSLTFWGKEHISANPAHILIGHGPGSSRVQAGGMDLASTLAEQRYNGLQIGYTAFSALLWDTGILGLAIVLGLFISAFRTANWLSHYYRHKDAFKAGLFDGLRAGIAVLMLSLVHKDYFAFHFPYQTLVMLIIGFLVVSRLQISRAAN